MLNCSRDQRWYAKLQSGPGVASGTGEIRPTRRLTIEKGPGRFQDTDNMSDNTSNTDDAPAVLFFKLQREAIEETGDFLEQMVETVTETREEFSLDGPRKLMEDSIELLRDSTHQSLDAMENVTDESASAELKDIRETVDSTFDTVLEQQEEVFDRLEEQSEDFEDETLDQIEEQVEFLIDTNEQVEEQITNAAEDFVEQAQEEGLTEGLGDQLDELLDRLNQQATDIADTDDSFANITVDSPGDS